MTYRSLLCVFTDEGEIAPALDAALALARLHDAHLEVLCIGRDATRYSIGVMGIDSTVALSAMSQAAEKSAALAELLRTRLAAEDVRWAVDDGGVQMLSLAAQVAPRARFADLVVVGASAGDGVAGDVLEAALFGARAPVLVVPPTGLGAWPPERVVIAWDGGDEAMAAVRAARGLLDSAQAVSVAAVDPGIWGVEGNEPGRALAQHLVRHGIKADVAVLPRGGQRVAEVLADHVRDTDAGLVVMGAYAHSRLRQLILGGTTRDMLNAAPVPVLMAR